jgi:uncharacterized protein (TIGR02118 family)
MSESAFFSNEYTHNRKGTTVIKLVYCIRKRDDIDDAEFHRYWLEDHGPLVKSVAEDIGACRYVQSHTGMADINDMLRASRPFRDPFDGITEVWWESEQAFRDGLATEAGQAAAARLAEDEARFIDIAGSHLFVTEEQEIF